MPSPFPPNLRALTETLLTMASYAEAAVSLAARAVFERESSLAERVKAEDRILDGYEMKLDEMAIGWLSDRRVPAGEVRLITMTMKVSQNLERTGDEATTIARRALALNQEPALRTSDDLRQLAGLALEMLKQALDAFVRGDAAQARCVIERDQTADALHQQSRQELLDLMLESPDQVQRALHLMVVGKSLERIADHATNIAEEAVYLHEGRDIRHSAKP